MAELNKLLAFMSSWDRQATLDRYEAMFDEGGDPEEVMERLGSPTKVAVDLAKDYISSRPPGEAIDRDEPEIEVISLEQLLAEEDAGVSLTVDPLPAEAPDSPAPAEAGVPAAPVIEEMPELIPDRPDEPGQSALKPPVWVPPATETKGGVPLKIFWVLAVLIGLPVAIALFCVGLIFPVAGVVIIMHTVKIIPALFSSFNLLSDVLLTAGAGVILLALGLLLIWFGLWLGLTLCRLWVFELVMPLGSRIRNRKGAQKA